MSEYTFLVNNTLVETSKILKMIKRELQRANAIEMTKVFYETGTYSDFEDQVERFLQAWELERVGSKGQTLR